MNAPPGITLREHVAALVIAAKAGRGDCGLPDGIARLAVTLADALVAELEHKAATPVCPLPPVPSAPAIPAPPVPVPDYGDRR